MASANRNTPLRRAKYGLLQHLPGELGLKYRRKLRKLFAPAAEEAFRQALAAAKGGICIDLVERSVQQRRNLLQGEAQIVQGIEAVKFSHHADGNCARRLNRFKWRWQS